VSPSTTEVGDPIQRHSGAEMPFSASGDAMLVLVVGGTRGTGLLAVHLLQQQGYGVRVLARDPRGVKAHTGPSIEIVQGDVTKAETLVPAVQGVRAILYTAGVRSGHWAGEDRIKHTDFEGVTHTLSAARTAGSVERFVYMTSIGGVAPSFSATLLNLVKRNVLKWRRRAEDAIRVSGMNYSVVRAGFLVNAPGGGRSVQISQGDLPLGPRYRIARADVAEVLVEALYHGGASHATFEVVWGDGPRRQGVAEMLSRLRPDSTTA